MCNTQITTECTNRRRAQRDAVRCVELVEISAVELELNQSWRV